MLKIILGVICIVVCTYIGYHFSKKFNKRKEFFLGFYNFNQSLISEVMFTKTTIKKILDKERIKSDFNLCLENYLLNKQIELSYLLDDDLVFVNDYFAKIGNLDSHAQLEYLNSINNNLNNLVNQTQENQKKYSKLYIKLGFLCGLILFILVV